MVQLPQAVGAADIQANWKSGHLLVSAKVGGGPVFAYKLNSMGIVHTLQNPTASVCLGVDSSRDFKRVCAYTDETSNQVLIWDITSGKIIVQTNAPVPLQGCLFNPSDENYVCAYGNQGVYIGKISSMLGEYCVEFVRVDLTGDLNDDAGLGSSSMPMCMEEVACIAWGLDNIVYVVDRSGMVWEVDTVKLTTKVCADIRQEVCGLLFTGNYLVVTTRNGRVHWVDISKHNQSPEQKHVLYTVELETDGELSCTFHNPTFSELFTLTSDGLLFQYPLEPLPGSKDDETDVSSTVQNVQQASNTLSPVVNLQSGVPLACAHFQYHNPHADDDISELSVFATASHDGTVYFWNETTSGTGQAGALLCALGSYRCLHLPNSSSNPEASPITALACCEAIGVLVVGTLHGVVEMLSMVCGAPETERQICSVEMLVLKRFKLFQQGVSKLVASQFSTVVALSMTDACVYFGGPVGGDGDRDVKILCHTNLGDHLPHNAVWVGGDVVILAKSASDPQATKFVGIQRDYISEALDAEPIPATWSFVHTEHVSGCIYLPVSKAMAFYAHDRCTVQICAWDHEKQHELAEELKRSTLAARQNVPIIDASATSNGTLLATSASDGTVSIWQATADGLVNVAQSTAHSTCISGMCFSPGARTILTAGVDGSVLLHELKHGLSQSEANSSAIQLLPLANVGEEDKTMVQPNLVRAQDPTWLEVQRQTFAESMVRLHEEGRQAILEKVRDLRSSVLDLLKRNEEAEEIERLERSEFVIDVEQERKLMAETQMKTNEIQRAHETFNLTNEAVAARLKEVCWDSQETHSMAVHALARPGVEVRKFGVHGPSTEGIIQLEKLKRLRWLEIAHQNSSYMRQDASDGDKPGPPQHFVTWPANSGHIGDSCTWVHNHGVRWPGSNVVAMLNNWAQLEQNLSSPEQTPSRSNTFAYDEDDHHSLNGELPEFDVHDISNYLYPPTAIRTEAQKRAQIVFLQHLICRMKTQFNEHVEKLKNDKEDAAHGINTRNARIAQILGELGNEVQLLSVETFADETPDKLLQVDANELTFEKYETEQQRQERLKHEEEQRRRQEEAQRDNIGARALQDMMYGTLEVPTASLIENKILTKPEWMTDTPPEELTDQQRKEIEEFEIRQAELKAEQDKYRKSLELELKKLRGEVNDICKTFDDKLESLARLYLLVAREVVLQELVVARLAHSIIEREHLVRTIGKIDEQTASLRAECASTVGTLDRLHEELENSRARVNTLMEEDKLLEKNFRKDLQSVSSIAFDQDTMKVFQQLYKRRFRDAVTDPTTDGSSMADKSSMNTSSHAGGMGQSSMRRSVSHKKSMQMSSMGRKSFSRRASGDRGSKQSTNSAEQAYGPLQEAMRALKEDVGALVTDKDPFVAADAARLRAEALLQAQVPKLTPLDQSRDCPETMIIEPLVWSKLQELRIAKIEKEIAIRAATLEQAEIKKNYDDVQSAVSELESTIAQLEQARENTIMAIQKADTDVELVVRIKQGQDEVVRDAVVTDYSDALLIPCSIVETHNDTIKSMGDNKIKVLHKIRKFRRRINLVEWETSHHQLCANDAEQYYTDLQLTKVTRDMQTVLRDGSNQSENRVAAAVERHRYLSKAYKQHNRKLMKNIQQLERQLEDLLEQNTNLQQQVNQQHEKLEARQTVAATRMPDSGLQASTEKARQAMDTIVMKRKITDMIKAQADEIEYLKRELDRLCERSFPRFAVANRARLGS